MWFPWGDRSLYLIVILSNLLILMESMGRYDQKILSWGSKAAGKFQVAPLVLMCLAGDNICVPLSDFFGHHFSAPFFLGVPLLFCSAIIHLLFWVDALYNFPYRFCGDGCCWCTIDHQPLPSSPTALPLSSPLPAACLSFLPMVVFCNLSSQRHSWWLVVVPPTRRYLIIYPLFLYCWATRTWFS